MSINRQKFKELVLHVAGRSSGDSGFGRTKLNKILFFSDFLYFADHGSSITGADYQKLPHGPAPRQMIPVLNELLGDDAEEKITHVGSFKQQRLVPKREADLSLFDDGEIDLVNDVIDMLDGTSAVDVSELSHQWSLGWQAASLGETIPYGTAFVRVPDDLPSTPEEGRSLARSLNLPVEPVSA